jgi:hypothetical protein
LDQFNRPVNYFLQEFWSHLEPWKTRVLRFKTVDTEIAGAPGINAAQQGPHAFESFRFSNSAGRAALLSFGQDFRPIWDRIPFLDVARVAVNCFWDDKWIVFQGLG